MSWLYLLVAVLVESVTNVAFKAPDNLTRPFPIMMMVMGHVAAFFFLSQSMKGIPIGIVYALWSGMVILAVCVLSSLVYSQRLDITMWIGVSFVAVGVMVILLAYTYSYKSEIIHI